MSSQTNLRLLATVMLITALCASAAPLTDAHTEILQGEASGEEEEGQKREISTWGTWEQVIGATKRHQQEFEEEFGGNVRYDTLDNYRSLSCPKNCDSNFSEEACLQTLAEGLPIYMVLLKHVEKEYPNSAILAEVKASLPLLVAVIKAKMRNSSQVVALTSSQENQLLKELNNPDAFNRKLKAHSILSSLHSFLIDGKRSLRRWESSQNQAAHTNGPQTS